MNFVKATSSEHVDEVSGKFEFFQRIFAHSPVSKQFIDASYITRRVLSNRTVSSLNYNLENRKILSFFNDILAADSNKSF